ncbi:MAG: carbon storage regulator [Lachnospiraceae bacterium]|nr:carbon storage regulator [Lachnospiraceae bacterium]
MLIIRRKKSESFLIGNDIRITILECAADGVRVAVDAPKHVSILREELSEAEQINRGALAPSTDSLLSLQTALSHIVSPEKRGDKKE